MKGKLAGVAVELDTLTDPDVAKAYEDSIDEILEKMSEAKLKERGSDGIRMQCEVVMMAIQNVFGEDIKSKIFGEHTNLIKCLDVFEEYMNLYPKQVVPLIEKKVRKITAARELNINIILDRLPESVEVRGKEYKIYSDFRTSILFETMMRSRELRPHEKIRQMLQIYYPVIPPDREEAVKKILWFYAGGKEAKQKREEKNQNKKIIPEESDSLQLRTGRTVHLCSIPQRIWNQSSEDKK